MRRRGERRAPSGQGAVGWAWTSSGSSRTCTGQHELHPEISQVGNLVVAEEHRTVAQVVEIEATQDDESESEEDVDRHAEGVLGQIHLRLKRSEVGLIRVHHIVVSPTTGERRRPSTCDAVENQSIGCPELRENRWKRRGDVHTGCRCSKKASPPLGQPLFFFERSALRDSSKQLERNGLQRDSRLAEYHVGANEYPRRVFHPVGPDEVGKAFPGGLKHR